MTYSSLIRQGKSVLETAGCANASFDALYLLENCTGRSKTYLFLHEDDIICNEIVQKYNSMIGRRARKEPLQYILGEWEFMGLKFNVGEGALIPRPETETLVELAVNELNQRDKAVVFDLCAGTGCIGISVAKYCFNAEVYLIEKSTQALKYLLLNIEKHNLTNAKPVEDDILNGFQSIALPEPDIILSNPPYIPSYELPLLQEEVQKEPAIALDGGTDGLDFYHILNRLWLPYVKHGGLMAVECGEGQADEISAEFSVNSQNIETVTDLNGIERVVIARR